MLPPTTGSRPEVLVTGAGGFIGRAVVRRLAAGGAHRAVALLRGPDDGVAGEGVTVRRCGDLARDEDLSFEGVDAVIHVAGVGDDASAAAAASWPDPDDGPALSTNARLTDRVVRVARRDGVRRLVLVSSVKVHGERSEGAPLTEASPIRPVGRYAESKVDSERVLRRLAGDRLETVVVRPVLVYGPGAGGNFARLVALARLPVPKPLAGVDNARSLVCVDNLADLLVRCVDHPGAAGEAFLAADAEAVSTAELLRLMAAASGRRPWLVPGSASLLRMAGRVSGASGAVERLVGSLVVDTAKANRRLGWRPPYSLADGIAKSVTASGDASTLVNART